MAPDSVNLEIAKTLVPLGMLVRLSIPWINGSKWLTPVVRRCLSEPGCVAVALCTLIILRRKDRKAGHFLIDFGPNREAKAEEEGIDKSIAKPNSAGNNVP